jgi:hypothetical protein
MEYDKARASHFDAQFKPLVLIAICNFLFWAFQFSSMESQQLRLTTAGIILALCIFWAIIRYKSKKIALFMPFVYLFTMCILVNLTLRD